MSRTHSRVYLVALTVWLLAWVALATSSDTTGVRIDAALASVFASNTVIFAIAGLRVQRGEVCREASGTVLPVTAEFVVMAVVLRLPIAVASVRNG